MEGRKTPLSIAVAAGVVMLLAVVVAVAVDSDSGSDSDSVVFSDDRDLPARPLPGGDAELTDEAPTMMGDHWHAAFGVYKCNAFLPPPEDNGRDPHGIHSHGDGVIHIHPFDSQVTGRRATLGAFEHSMAAIFDRDEIRIGRELMLISQTQCGGRRARVQVFVDGSPYDGEPSSIRLHDRQTIVIAFAPEGADVPRIPPTAATLDNLSDVPPNA